MTKQNREWITHMARVYTNRELAEALFRASRDPYTSYITHLDRIRIERLPSRIRAVETRLRSLQASFHRLSPGSPRWHKVWRRRISLEVSLDMFRAELARHQKQEQETEGKTS